MMAEKANERRPRASWSPIENGTTLAGKWPVGEHTLNLLIGRSGSQTCLGSASLPDEHKGLAVKTTRRECLCCERCFGHNVLTLGHPHRHSSELAR